MTDEINYQNNPLHGLSLNQMLTELVDHYGFKILHAYLQINCFNKNPSIESAEKFLKKTTWAREKVEAFYMYQYKSLPKAKYDQYQIPPRDRIIPDDQRPGEPKELSLEDAERLHEQRERRAAERGKARSVDKVRRSPKAQTRTSETRKPSSEDGAIDPWANSKWKK